MKSLKKFLDRDPRIRFSLQQGSEIIETMAGNIARFRGPVTKSSSELFKFLQSHQDLFGKIDTESLEKKLDVSDEKGYTVIYRQTLNGVEVEDGTIQFHVDRQHTLRRVKNHLLSLKGVNSKPKIHEKEAIKAFRNKIKSDGTIESKPRLIIAKTEKGSPALMYQFDYLTKSLVNRRNIHPMLAEVHGGDHLWRVYVDASTNEVIRYYDNMQTIATTGSGIGVYSGTHTNTLNTWDNGGGNYQLRDTSNGAGMPEILTEDGGSPSTDTDNNWNDNSTSPRNANQGAEVDSHFYTKNVIDYYNLVHGRNGIDNAGSDVSVQAHYGTNTDNAYWNGTKLLIGDGSGAAPGFNYLCTEDVMAHEFTHGVVQHTCNLTYSNESGALNEAVADIFAALITNNWLIGEQCWLKTTAPALRNMMDPTNGGNWDIADPINSVIAGHQPSHYSQRYTGASDNGGVHINSGIINHLFYLLTVGGTHTLSNISVTGVGQTIAEQLLYRTISVNLVGQPNATFIDFRAAMLEACQDLFPTNLQVLTQVKNAFNAVGIGPDIYVRNTIADTGEEPFLSNPLCISPDIINRQNPVANPSVDLANMADGNLSENVEKGQDNYVYVRLQNRGTADGNATINVYLIAATTFGTPASWIHIGSTTEFNIIPGSSRISGPITLPQASIPGIGHYCMCAVISDPLDPAPDHTLINSVADYVNYVRNTNNIAYRNMEVVDLIPGLTGRIRFIAERFSKTQELFDLEIDTKNFIPQAELKLKANRNMLKEAHIMKMKPVKNLRTKQILRLEANTKVNNRFFGKEVPKSNIYALKNLHLKRNTMIEMEYQLPKSLDLNKLIQKEYSVVIRQLWKGALVGDFTLVFRKP